MASKTCTERHVSIFPYVLRLGARQGGPAPACHLQAHSPARHNSPSGLFEGEEHFIIKGFPSREIVSLRPSLAARRHLQSQNEHVLHFLSALVYVLTL